MQTGKVVTAYRFDETVPKIGKVVHCFKSFEALEDFAKLQGNQFSNVRFWKIRGTVVRDEGGPDGWVIKVEKYQEISLSLY
jgi:hypothetical protein